MTICSGRLSASALEEQKSARIRYALITVLRFCTEKNPQRGVKKSTAVHISRRPHLGFSDATIPKDEDPH